MNDKTELLDCGDRPEGESMKSVLTKRQTKVYGPRSAPSYPGCTIRATVRYDDECSNGHNTFVVTAEIQDPKIRRDGGWVAGGCLHEEIAAAFPELTPFIKWHLTSSDGPMHYKANTLYWMKLYKLRIAQDGGPIPAEHSAEWFLEAARSSAVWPNAKPEDITDVNLEERLLALMAEFKRDVESLGLTF